MTKKITAENAEDAEDAEKKKEGEAPEFFFSLRSLRSRR